MARIFDHTRRGSPRTIGPIALPAPQAGNGRGGAKPRRYPITTARFLAAVAALHLLVGLATPAAAAGDEAAALKVPRFASLRSDKVNLRTGPGKQYPIEWVLTRKEMPVEVTAQFEHWRRIREWDGTQGWVEEHMIDGKRFVVIAKGGDRALRQSPDPAAPVIAKAEPGAVAKLAECRGAWCHIQADAIAGWLPRTDLWGIYPDEAVP